jgi:hypothetical protein
MEDYYGLYCHAELRRDEAEAKYQRLCQLYAHQQDIILKLTRKGYKVCEGSTTITYMMQPAEELEDNDEI